MTPLSTDLRHWMFEDALPFWAEHGIDREGGGYVEQLDLAGRSQNPFKRVRVICRQIYVFSHAAVLGWSGGEALSERGYRYLLDHAWLGPDGGWARRLDAHGRVMDPTPDLYDLAFVLFALAWRHRASGDPEALSWAGRTLDFIEARMRHPGGEGFLHEKPASGPRQQNPHMHLLEAALVLLETSGDPRFGDLVNELTGLFAARFYDPRSRTLAEYFGEDWSRADGAQGRIVEPGHQFEWAWILANTQRLTGFDARELVAGLVGFAESYGVDPATGATYNQVTADGEPLDRGSRVWPNTERMKGAVAMHELFGRDPRPVLEQSGRVLLNRYLAVQPVGTWMDEFNDKGHAASKLVPASTLYHLFLAFAESLRVLDGPDDHITALGPAG